MNPLRLALGILACYRLALLLSEDDGPLFVFTRLRQWADRLAIAEQERGISRGVAQSLSEGINCPFCTGIWSACLLAVLVNWPTALGDFILSLLAIAGGQAWLQKRSDEEI